MARWPRGFFVSGTDTGVGKTLVACALAAHLQRRGARVSALKPVETGSQAHEPSDACCLASATGNSGSASRALYSFRQPLAPWVASREEARVIDLDEISDLSSAAQAQLRR